MKSVICPGTVLRELSDGTVEIASSLRFSQ
jgi:hypothetical protein